MPSHALLYVQIGGAKPGMVVERRAAARHRDTTSVFCGLSSKIMLFVAKKPVPKRQPWLIAIYIYCNVLLPTDFFSYLNSYLSMPLGASTSLPFLHNFFLLLQYYYIPLLFEYKRFLILYIREADIADNIATYNLYGNYENFLFI